MIELIHHEAVADWVVEAIEDRSKEDLGPFEAFGFVSDGVPVGGVIFAGYCEKSKSIQAWIRGTPGRPWLKRNVLRKMFEIPFVGMGCEAIRCCIKEGNTGSEKLCKHLGFRREGILRRGWNGKTNLLMYGMLKSECKWIK